MQKNINNNTTTLGYLLQTNPSLLHQLNNLNNEGRTVLNNYIQQQQLLQQQFANNLKILDQQPLNNSLNSLVQPIKENGNTLHQLLDVNYNKSPQFLQNNTNPSLSGITRQANDNNNKSNTVDVAEESICFNMNTIKKLKDKVKILTKTLDELDQFIAKEFGKIKKSHLNSQIIKYFNKYGVLDKDFNYGDDDVVVIDDDENNNNNIRTYVKLFITDYKNMCGAFLNICRKCDKNTAIISELKSEVGILKKENKQLHTILKDKNNQINKYKKPQRKRKIVINELGHPSRKKRRIGSSCSSFDENKDEKNNFYRKKISHKDKSEHDISYRIPNRIPKIPPKTQITYHKKKNKKRTFSAHKLKTKNHHTSNNNTKSINTNNIDYSF